MNTLFNFTLHTISSAISIYLFYFFFNTFFPKTTKPLAKYIILILSEVLFVLSLTLFFDYVLIRLLVSTIVIVMVSFLFKMKWYYHIIMSITLYAMLSISEYATGSLVSIIFSVDMKTGVSGKFFIIGLFLSKIIAFIFVNIIRMAKYRFTNTKFQRNLLATIAIPVSTMLVILLQYKFMTHIEEVSLTLSFLSLFCYTALIISNILMFDWLNYVAKAVEKDIKLAAASELITLQSKQYLDMIEHNKHISQLRHDYRNFLIGVLSEMDESNFPSARIAITNELEELSSPSSLHFSQGIIGLIIEYKRTFAHKKDIEIEADISGINNIKISPIDLSIALGNALDNAIEATEKVSHHPKVIHLMVKAVNNTIVITIRNPTNTEVDIDDLKSSKDDKSLHGFGIYSIKNIASKYGGEVIFQYNNFEFKTNIILRNNEYSQKSNE